nr:DUF2235 domain-containing protein [uncultured Desulfobacter sp.]
MPGRSCGGEYFLQKDAFPDYQPGPLIRALCFPNNHDRAIARHALAIDEQREGFEPTIWNPNSGVDLKQIWFAGVHSDVGGSYPPDKKTGIRTSDTPLAWMIDEAINAGLEIESHIKDFLTDGTKGNLHKFRDYVYRFKSPLHRPLTIENKPTKIHPSVKKLVEQFGWDNLDVGV